MFGPRMNANERKYLDCLFEKVIGCAYEVSNVLGSGFLEKIYERALAHELSLRGLKVQAQACLSVSYKGHSVGNYLADLVVENCVTVELKCVEAFSNEHTAQCINYLRASDMKIALLINFQRPKVEWKRIVLGLYGICVHSRSFAAKEHPFPDTPQLVCSNCTVVW